MHLQGDRVRKGGGSLFPSKKNSFVARQIRHMDKRVGLAVEEEAAAKVATLLLRASENAAPADSDSEDGDGADAAPQRRHPQSRRRTSAPVGVEGGYGTIAGGPQRPSRPLKAEQGAYPVGALTEQLLRDEEVARILKHLEKKGFHDDDTDMGPGGAGVRHAPDPKMRLNVHLVGTRRLPGGIGYIADEGPTPKVTAPSRDCFSPEPVDGEDCAPAGSYHPPSHVRGYAMPSVPHSSVRRPAPDAADSVLSPREGGGDARPMPKGGFRRNPLYGRRHAAVRLPRHTEGHTRYRVLIARCTRGLDPCGRRDAALVCVCACLRSRPCACFVCAGL